MWPWEHLAVGYVCYSLGVWAWRRSPPKAAGALLLAVGTQLPDLVDKPLSWVYAVFPGGYGPGHSVFVAVPMALVVVLIAGHLGRPVAGAGLAVGWWSHLAGDVVVAVLRDNPYAFDRILWPTVSLPPDGLMLDGLGYVHYFLRHGVDRAQTQGQELFLVAYVGVFVAAVLLWLVDGAPGMPKPWRWMERADETRAGD